MLDFIKTLEEKFEINIVHLKDDFDGFFAHSSKNYMHLDESGNVKRLALNKVNLKSFKELLPIANTLTELYVDDCNIKKLGSLKHFQNLERLDLGANDLSVKSLKNLTYLEKLKQLNLEYTGLKDTSVLGDLKNLEALYLGFNTKLSKVKNLDKLESLKHLSLRDNSVENVRKISENNSVHSLDLGNNGITKISHLEKFPNLTKLRLSGNRVRKIKRLDNLTKLKELHCDASPLEEIKGLDHLTNLEILDLSCNQISEIKGLEQLTKLRKLNLNENHITKVENLDGLINLELLLLEANDIKAFDTTFLQHLATECRIYIRGYKNLNDIEAISPKHVKFNFDNNYPFPTCLYWPYSIHEYLYGIKDLGQNGILPQNANFPFPASLDYPSLDRHE